MELNAAGATAARYTLAPFGYGDLVSQRRSGVSSFYHFDALGTTRRVTAADESTQLTYVRDAFGSGIASTGTTTNRFRYLGKLGYVQEDTLAGALLRRRYYQYEIGRFVSRDPVRSRDKNRYSYVGARPTKRVDPSGLMATAEHCAQLAKGLARLVAEGVFPRSCETLNTELYRYIGECTLVQITPEFPHPPYSCRAPRPVWTPVLPPEVTEAQAKWLDRCHSRPEPQPSSGGPGATPYPVAPPQTEGQQPDQDDRWPYGGPGVVMPPAPAEPPARTGPPAGDPLEEWRRNRFRQPDQPPPGQPGRTEPFPDPGVPTGP